MILQQFVFNCMLDPLASPVPTNLCRSTCPQQVFTLIFFIFIRFKVELQLFRNEERDLWIAWVSVLEKPQKGRAEIQNAK